MDDPPEAVVGVLDYGAIEGVFQLGYAVLIVVSKVVVFAFYVGCCDEVAVGVVAEADFATRAV